MWDEIENQIQDVWQGIPGTKMLKGLKLKYYIITIGGKSTRNVKYYKYNSQHIAESMDTRYEQYCYRR